jgi:hypothetical protein
LQGEQIARVMVKPLGPKVRVGLSTDQLGVDTNLVSGSLYAPFQYIAHSQFAPNLPCVHWLVLVGERGVGRDHEHMCNARQIGSQILSNSISKVLLIGIVTEIGARQNDY